MKITIEQIDRETGDVFRTFEYHRAFTWRNQDDLDALLDRIAFGYNLAATRVLVDGVQVETTADGLQLVGPDLLQLRANEMNARV